MRALPSGVAKDDGYFGAVDAWGVERETVSGGFGVGGGALLGDESYFDLRVGADCAGTGAVGFETFPGRGGRACFEGGVSQRDLFFGGGAGGGGFAGGDSALKREKDATERKRGKKQRKDRITLRRRGR